MGSMFGTYFKITLFGESHSAQMGVVIDGLQAGISIDFAHITHQLMLRRPSGDFSTQRQEQDSFSVMSGYFNQYTTGAPLCVLIENNQMISRDYESLKDYLRPSHADYTAYLKYDGFQDYRGGGHFSGRLTAPIVIAGAIAIQILSKKGIKIGTHIKTLEHISDDRFHEDRLEEEIQLLNQKKFATISDTAECKMKAAILKAKEEKDSVGGILETCVIGLDGGIGEPFFDGIESILSHLLFSIPAVKGVEFGDGFALATLRGSQANDVFYFDGKIKTKTNHNGGINGGISNGMPILIKTVVKPTPSIGGKQKTIHIKTKEETELIIQGRHDPAIIHRARVVVDSMVAIGLLELLLARYGNEWMR